MQKKLLTAKGVVGIWPANAVGDDINVYDADGSGKQLGTFHTLRQQEEREDSTYYALSDFIAPKVRPTLTLTLTRTLTLPLTLTLTPTLTPAPTLTLTLTLNLTLTRTRASRTTSAPSPSAAASAARRCARSCAPRTTTTRAS